MLRSHRLSLHAFVLALGLASGTLLHANNILVSNATITGNNGTEGFFLVQFDVSWENSWRGGAVTNWDAAWVFVKLRNQAGIWKHGKLDDNGHSAPSGSVIEVGLKVPGTPFNTTANPGIGAFIHRGSDGNGTFALTGVQLRVNYASVGLNYNDIAEVNVLAIEMVYVPQGPYWAGGIGGESNAFSQTRINTANATVMPVDPGGGIEEGGYPAGQTAPSSASWPNGFNAFYCMKYEISQQGYVDFLNTLDSQILRTATSPGSPAGTGAMVNPNVNRNGIDIQTSVNAAHAIYACNLNGNTIYGEADDGKDIACNYLSWEDLGAYLDWSGLRPMSELEFEKAARGPADPVPNEYAWGTSGIALDPYTLLNAGTNDEQIATNYRTDVGNAIYTGTDGTIDGPLRVGCFAAHGNNNGRATSGASYYGIMEMSGNLSERIVTIGSPAGRAFTGEHGDGTITNSGQYDLPTWPNHTADGTGFRGGYWNNSAPNIQLANRGSATQVLGNRASIFGGRGVRSAP